MSYVDRVGGAVPGIVPAATSGVAAERAGGTAVAPAEVTAAPHDGHGRPTLAVALATWSAAAAVLGVLLAVEGGQTWQQLVDEHTIIGAVVAISFSVVGAFVISRQPRHVLAWLFLAIGQSQTLAGLAAGYGVRQPALPGADVAAVVGDLSWMPGFAMAALIPLLFPDGRAASPRWRPIVRLAWVAVGTVTVGVLFIQPPDVYPRHHNVLAPPRPLEHVLVAVVLAALAVALAGGLAGVIGLVVRTVRSQGHERRRLLWFVVAFVAVVVCSALPVSVLILTIAYSLLPVALGIAMLREGLFDGDRLLNRTLVYGLLTAVIATVFGVTAGLLSTLVGGSATAAVIAAVVVALGLTPVRQSVQHLVDRALYGDRRDPYAALSRLGDQLAGALAPDEALPAATRTVATSLRLPYAAITLAGDPAPTAVHGTPVATHVELALVHRGDQVGVLTVGLRGGRRFLDPGDERLVRGFAQQIAVAADAVRLTHQLRRSRDELAVAREEERHRIRRDLHDGLGPALAGVALGLGAARRTAGPEAADLLDHLQREVNDSLADVKRLISDLRPSTLDQLGLHQALTQYAEAVTARSGGTLSVQVDAAPPAAALPADVEVAVYRIVLEAVTNVTRHAAARTCRVRLEVTPDTLTLSIRDDGIGVPEQRDGGGLGLRSMAERALELDGECDVSAGPDGGTTVQVTIPLWGPR